MLRRPGRRKLSIYHHRSLQATFGKAAEIFDNVIKKGCLDASIKHTWQKTT